MAAQLVLEEGLHLIVTGGIEEVPILFELAAKRHMAAKEPGAVARMFDVLAFQVRTSLLRKALQSDDVALAFQHTNRGSSMSAVQHGLAANAAVLCYVTVGDQVKVLVVGHTSAEILTLERSAGEARYAAQQMLSADDAGFAAAAAELHDIVFGPLSQRLDGVSTIAIIPIPELAEIPFGSLFDRESGKYLHERFTIVHDETASAAMDRSKRIGERSDPMLLAIAAGEFDHGDALPEVERETSEIAAASRCARVFSESQATPDVIERELAENAVIHYAGHIVTRGADPRLLLAASHGKATLSATEIARLPLQKARVVVLAGCGGASKGPGSEAVSTMADAFLAAGVPMVIASSYDIDDADAPATMRRLHTFLRDGDDAPEALRKTVLAELKTRRSVPLSLRLHALGGSRTLVR
jgi:CHAT domain-containing protein